MLRRVDVAFLLTGAVLPALGAFVAVPALQAAGVPREAAVGAVVGLWVGAAGDSASGGQGRWGLPCTLPCTLPRHVTQLLPHAAVAQHCPPFWHEPRRFGRLG